MFPYGYNGETLSSLFLGHFDLIFILLLVKWDCSKISTEFEFCPDRTTWLRVTCPCAYRKTVATTCLGHLITSLPQTCLFVLRFYGPVERGQFTQPHVYWAGLVLYAVNQYCAHSFARNWQLAFLNQRKGENDRRKYFMINLHERMLPTSAGVEPATSWSPVGRRIQLSHRGRHLKLVSKHICNF